MKAAFLVDSDTDSLTYRDLQARVVDEVRKKLQRQREQRTRRGARPLAPGHDGRLGGRRRARSLPQMAGAWPSVWATPKLHR